MREWLREARKARGFTQKEMADMLDVSVSYYCMVETGQRQSRLDIPLACGLADALGIPLGTVIRNETR